MLPAMKGHPGLLYMDHFEPTQIRDRLNEVTPVAWVPLNTWEKADYYLVDLQGNERMVERKQLSEALSDLDAVEAQLGEHIRECDELTLLVEGVGVPTASGVQTYTYANGAWSEGYAHTRQPQLWSRWCGFKHSLRHHAGVEVEEVSHWYCTVQWLHTWFKKSLDPTSTTLQRYVIPHIPPMNKDSQVDNLCRLRGMGMGEKTALQLIGEFGTIHGVMTAGYADLVGLMGGAWTRKFLKAIGREE